MTDHASEQWDLVDRERARGDALAAELAARTGTALSLTKQFDGLRSRIAALEAALQFIADGHCKRAGAWSPESIAGTVLRVETPIEALDHPIGEGVTAESFTLETEVDPGVAHDACRYLAPTGGVCNKCGFPAPETPAQATKLMPCWCPYCGEPHSPDIHEESRATRTTAKISSESK